MKSNSDAEYNEQISNDQSLLGDRESTMELLEKSEHLNNLVKEQVQK